jgi:hypothetical protein
MTAWRYRGCIAALRPLLLTASTNCVIVSFLAQQPALPSGAFRTSARFSVDAEVLQLQTAVAIAEDRDRSKNSSRVRIYFYAFPLTAEDIGTLSRGSVAALERKRNSMGGPPGLNHSRAVLHFLLDKNSALSNASLEIPGLTCTIVAESATAKNAVQLFQFSGTQLRVEARGNTSCDLTSIGGRKRAMSWDVNVDVPVFTQR